MFCIKIHVLCLMLETFNLDLSPKGLWFYQVYASRGFPRDVMNLNHFQQHLPITRGGLLSFAFETEEHGSLFPW